MKPSIFNDVIGPVMRGPSSSHTAAAHRIGTIIRQFHHPENCTISVEFDRSGSLATTYEGQGSAMGLISGLCGLSILDPEIKEYKLLPARHNFTIEFKITDFEASHPNTYKISLTDNSYETLQIVAISTGGGMIKVIGLNGFPVSINGDLYETFICFKNESAERIEELNLKLKHHFSTETELIKKGKDNYLLIIKSRKSILNDSEAICRRTEGILWIREIDPVLPVMSGACKAMPFADINEVLEFIEGKKTDLAELAIQYECARGGIDENKVLSLMREITANVEHSIREGLKEKSYPGRILGHQSHLILAAEKEGKIISSPLNTVLSYVTALMESKSSMEIIVAAPTAGSCGTLGGAIFGIAEQISKTPDDIVKAFLAAGLIGVFIADKYTFAAEEGGCQVECGAASAMAAAGLVQLMGGSARHAINASSMALQNCLGMICDPVADRVEVPCLGKNILAATNALNSANMAIAGFDPVIPLDEVIDAMKKVGDEIPRSLCCTGLGGLSQTPSSLRLHEKLIRI
jgi:L-serine dehydratase